MSQAHGASGTPEPSGPDLPAGPASPQQAGLPEQPGLSERDRTVLEIASANWTGPGPRERAVRERLGISPAVYFQLLNALLDDPRALRHDPLTVNRMRAARTRHREAR
jgi:hypothetical protein